MATAETGLDRRMAAGNFSWDFEPDAVRARQMDQLMRSRLANSLRHIQEQAGTVLDTLPQEIEPFLGRLEAAPVSPVAFSYYFDIVLALEREEYAEARGFWQKLIALPSFSGGLRIQELVDPRHDEAAARYVRFFIADTGSDFQIFPPRPEESVQCRALIEGAFDLMKAGDPALANEISELVREITLASGSMDPAALTFDGSSSFMMWGGILLNARRGGGVLELVQMLAHESAHNLLFGMTTEEPLTLNSEDERYQSPLRIDPRPMEGIYHATYVSARMYRCVRRLLDSGVLDASQTELAEKDSAANAQFFRGGWKVVEEHGRLTPLGRGLMDSARAAMAAVF